MRQVMPSCNYKKNNIYVKPRFITQVSFNVQAWLHEFHGCWSPNAPNKPFNKPCKSGSISFKRSNNNHDKIGVWIKFGGMCDAVIDFFASVNLFHGRKNDLNW